MKNLSKIRTLPALPSKHVVRPRQCYEPALEPAKIFACIYTTEGLRSQRLNRGERVLHAVVQFVDQELAVFFAASPFSNIARDLRRADDATAASFKGETVKETSIRLPSFRIRTVS